MQKTIKPVTMKKIVTLSLAFTALVFSAQAQQQRDVEKDKNKTERHEGQKAGRHDMRQDLKLSEAQKAQLKANREEFRAKMDQLKTLSLTQAERKERKKALMAEQKAKMQNILTAQQKAQLQAKRNEGGSKGTFQGKKRVHGDKQLMLKETLSLSDDQAAKLKAQHEELKQRKIAIKNDASLSNDAKKAKMRALKMEAAEQRKSILTADQVKGMREFKKDHKNKHPKKAKK